ncbi:hypothetical protein QA640_09075 [Bradyrhizobium sp. CB82]|uniref:hypothetical protein n=1 Tax=Bradyrhizobium sp. CB82 TaxID=3039159 RepID=UPI0024B07C7C|nr:hypothetical protein [Bradyrhizobium sp. CB82]WFU45389.1 hypothetical protein QA640_09075 [Bradyrhizobium sp. CB82]
MLGLLPAQEGLDDAHAAAAAGTRMLWRVSRRSLAVVEQDVRTARRPAELAWGHLVHQKASALTAWYRKRTSDARGGTRKTMIVALHQLQLGIDMLLGCSNSLTSTTHAACTNSLAYGAAGTHGSD